MTEAAAAIMMLLMGTETSSTTVDNERGNANMALALEGDSFGIGNGGKRCCRLD